MLLSVFSKRNSHLNYVLATLCVLWLTGCRQVLLEATLKPLGHYEPTREPPTTDYSKTSSWAALPDRSDTADRVPWGETNRQSSSKADVFFVHPTTYIRGKDWNQSLANTEVNYATDWRSIRNQASVFNACCRVYAPRYRQAILYSFITDQADGKQALELAYRDVQAAFRYFIKHFNKGRPFVLAGHSQGAYHLVRLLQEEISGKPLRKRLVVAYAVGIPIPLDLIQQTMPDIPVCQNAQQTSCLVSWNTYGINASSKRLGIIRMRYPKGLVKIGSKPIVCVNPLTWNTRENEADASSNQGGIVFGTDPAAVPKPDVHLVSAQCRQGVLRISHPAFYRYRRLTGAGDYHNFDYQLFYINIRQNAVSRVRSFLSKGHKPDARLSR